jgi:porphyrinogen peroxidase
MALAQPGVFAPTEPHHYALEYSLIPNSDVEDVRLQLGMLITELRTCTGTGHVLAFGPALCGILDISPTSRPFNEFNTIQGLDGTSAPASQHDLLIWMQGAARDQLFDVARAVEKILHPIMNRALEIQGFIRHESRDLTGFIDGSANPTGDLMFETALIPDGLADEGGSFVLTQKWRHDLTPFHALSIPEQEGIIGRTKADSIELEGDDMPANSHVSRTDASLNGEPQRIYRRSFPYGTLDEHGLYFLAFAHDQSRFDIQLRRMYGATEDGIRDRITDFSTALTGSYFYAPSSDLLDRITR